MVDKRYYICMAELDSLIRVRKHGLDQKQKFLAELYRQSEELAAQKQALLTQVEEERAKTEELGVEMMGYFGSYAQAVKQRVADIDAAAAQLDERIEAAREDMRSAFAELKKIEMTQERREDEAQAERDKKDADVLDEIAIQNYLRAQDE